MNVSRDLHCRSRYTGFVACTNVPCNTYYLFEIIRISSFLLSSFTIINIKCKYKILILINNLAWKIFHKEYYVKLWEIQIASFEIFNFKNQ